MLLKHSSASEQRMGFYLLLFMILSAPLARSEGIVMISPKDGDVLYATGSNQGFMDLTFDFAAKLRQGCAIHMLLDNRRVAYWIPDPMLPAGATGEPNLWRMNGWTEAFTKGMRTSISVYIQPGSHRAWVTMACKSGQGDLWKTWDESECASRAHGATCMRSPKVAFSVSPLKGASTPRVELTFPGSPAVVKHGSPIVIDVSLSGMLLADESDSCLVQVVLREEHWHNREASVNDIPCNNFVREGTPGSEARLVGSFHTRLVVGAEPFLRDPKPRGAHGAEGE